jgi:hypothetical protein
MKRTSIFKVLLLLLLMAGKLNLHAQIQHYSIGGAENEVAVAVKDLPDGSGKIIAGYRYDVLLPGATDISNAQMFVLKVNPAGTAILWQEEFGLAGTNNLIQDMIITHDNDIVLVGTMGRSNTFLNNHAAILKFRSTDGVLLWQHIFNASTVGGEIFYGVTELGASRGYALVAIGGYDHRPGFSDGLLAVYSAAGALQYSERYASSYNNSESFSGICTSADGNDVYIVGYVRAIVFHDGRVHMYRTDPSLTFGSMVWSRYFNFVLAGVDTKGNSTNLTLNNNFFSDVFLRNDKLIIMGGSLNAFTFTGGAGESISRMRADGTGPMELWQIQNSGQNYSGPTKLFPINDDILVNLQTPTNVWFDPIIWLTGTFTNSVITPVTSLSGMTTNPPVQLLTNLPGIHSLFDLDYTSSGDLYMAGSTTDAGGFGNNDVYYVSALVSISDSGCWNPDSVGMKPYTPDEVFPTFTVSTFPVTTVSVTPIPTTFGIKTLCDSLPPHPFQCDNRSFDEGLTDLTFTSTYTDTGGCAFVVTATGITAPGWTMLGYLWTYGGSSVWDLTSSSTDVKVITLGYSGTDIVHVKFFAVNANGDTCYTDRTIDLECNRPPCFFKNCSKMIVTPISSGDSCTFTACVDICTAYRILGYSWTLSTGGSVTHHTSATHDCWTFTIPSGVTATVQVIAHIVDTNFADGTDPCCRAEFSEEVTCKKIPPEGCDCFDEGATHVTVGSLTSTIFQCRYVVTANTALNNPQCQILGYEWITSSSSTFIPSSLTSNARIVVLAAGTTETVQVNILAISPSGDTCVITRYVVLDCPGVSGGFCDCFDEPGSSITSYLALTTDGCEYTVSAFAPLLNNNCNIVAHQWSVNGLSSPMVYSGSNFENRTVTMLAGTSTVVSITFFAISPTGDTCTIVKTITLECQGGMHPSKPGAGNPATDHKISVFPNPTNEDVTVSSTDQAISTVEVIDVNGKKVGNYTFKNVKSVNIPMENRAPGAYMFKINKTTSVVVMKGSK